MTHSIQYSLNDPIYIVCTGVTNGEKHAMIMKVIAAEKMRFLILSAFTEPHL